MNERPPDRLAWIEQELVALDAAGLCRRLPQRAGAQSVRLAIDGRKLVNFGSNDYLALASDPRLIAAVTQTAEDEGFGSGASPLLSGHGSAHRRLEQRLAEFEGTEAALVFSSGFAANAGTIAALVGRGDVVYTDRNNHASLLDGCRLSRADVRVYPHNDHRRLDALLETAGNYRRRLIVTDGLFSMDGDLAPLRELAEVARRRDAMLLVDEAHATGVFGPYGRGVSEHLGVENQVDVRIGTLSKALGSVGGFVAGRRSLIDWLVNRARTFIYSTATPAAVAAAASVALGIVRSEPGRRNRLLDRAAKLRRALTERGFNVGNSAGQIIPLIVGESQRAVELSGRLLHRDLFVPAIRPPTVPEGEARLRISLTAGHTAEMVVTLLAALSD